MDNLEYTNPFPGLRSFEEDEEHLFFGREKQIDDLLAKLSKSKLVAVLGASGSGKSSLVKSGLLPSLHSGFLQGVGTGWKICVFRPGTDPIGNLSKAISSDQVLGSEEIDHPCEPQMVEAILRRNKSGIDDTFKQIVPGFKENLLIVVDQFEELFRFSKYEKEAQKGTRDSVAFINLLLEVANLENAPYYVVFTMRSEYLGDCTEFRGFPEAINEGQYLVPRMTREEKKLAITGPIAIGGGKISPVLLNRLLNDIGESNDQLPILQHALMRTWDYWVNNNTENEPLDLAHYEAIGTLLTALSEHAEEAYSEIESEKGKLICEKLFKTITEKGVDGRRIRRPTKLEEILELTESTFDEVKSIIEIFRKPGRSFLTPSIDNKLTENSVIDISHESLMRIWTRLINWVDEEGQSSEIYIRLSKASALYQEGKTALWREPELQIALKWREINSPNRKWALRYDPAFERAMTFLDYSKKQYNLQGKIKEKQRRQKFRLAVTFVVILGMAFLGSVVLGYKAYKNEQVALSAQLSLEIEKDTAHAAKTRALQAMQKAHENEQMAKGLATSLELQKDSALHLKVEAEQAAKRARKSALAAIFAKNQAEEAKEKADSLLIVTDSAKTKAIEAKNEAIIAKQNEKKLGLLSASKLLANKALNFLEDSQNDTLGMLLALHAFHINKEKNGPKQVTINYQALNRANIEMNKKNRTDVAVVKNGYDLKTVLFWDNGKSFITGGEDGILRVWDNLKAKETIKVPGKGIVTCIQTLTDGKNLLIGDIKGNIWKSDINSKGKRSLTKVASSDLTNKPIISCYSLPKDLILGATKDSVFLFKPNKKNDFSFQKSIEKNSITDVKYISSKSILAIGKKDGSIKIYNLKENNLSLIKTISFKQEPKKIALSKNGTFLAAGGSNGILRIWDLQNNKLVREYREHKSSISSIVFNHQENQVASSSYDQTCRLYLFKSSKEEVLELKDFKKWVIGVDFHPNGNKLVSVGQSGTIRIWPTKTELLANELCHKVIRKLTKEELNNHLEQEFEYEKNNCVYP